MTHPIYRVRAFEIVAPYTLRVRFDDVDAMVHTEIDGWVLRGQVDIEALLDATRDRLNAFRSSGGEVNIPIDVHIATVKKS